ncbi:hypothetical protein ABKV19_027399, partial [Rosa sericea]
SLDAENSLEKIKRQLASGLHRNLLQDPITSFLINYKWLLYIVAEIVIKFGASGFSIRMNAVSIQVV